MARDDINIDVKLNVAGVQVGNLDAGTLKFDVDVSALQKLVSEATKTASDVKTKFDSIKLNQFKIDVDQNSLRAMSEQIRKAIESAAGNVSLKLGTGSQSSSSLKSITSGAASLNYEIEKVEGSLQSLPKNILDNVLEIPGLTKDVRDFAQLLQSNLNQALFGTEKEARSAQKSLADMVDTVNQLRTAQGKRPVSPVQALNAVRSQALKDNAAQEKAEERLTAQREKEHRARLREIDDETSSEARSLQQQIRAEDTLASQRDRQHQRVLSQIDARTQAEVKALQQALAEDQKLEAQRLSGIQKQIAAQRQADQENISRVQKLKSELEGLSRREAQLSGGGAGGRGGNIPPGGFGATPPGGDASKGISSIRQLQAAMSSLNDETKGASRSFDDLNQLAFEVGRKAAAFRGVAIAINTVISSAQSAVKFLIDFNDSLLELNKVLNTSVGTLKIVGDELFELSVKTGVAVDQTVKIAQEFARAGLEGRGYGSIVELTNQALTGLQGTTLDAAQSSAVLIQIIQQIESGARGLNKEIITTGKLFDVLGKAEDITAAEAKDVAEALKRSAASLFATGSSIEEVTSLISVLQERTQRGGDVIGTALKTIASRIASSSSEASQALKGIGVATVDSQGKLRKTYDVLQDTANAFRNLSEVEQANIGVKVAGLREVEVFRAALIDFNRVQQVQEELSQAQGDAARKQAVEQEKLATVLEKIKIGFQELIKSASESVLGEAFAVAVKGALELVTAINNLNSGLGGTIASFSGFLILKAASKALIPLVGGIAKAFSAFVALEKESKGAMDGVNTSAKALGSTIDRGVNGALRNTALIMKELNAQMLEFEHTTELAAVRSEKLAKAKELARQELSGTATGVGVSNQAINARAQELIQQQNQQRLTAREAAFRGVIASGGAGGLVKAAKERPETFSSKELERIGRLEKSLAGQSSKLGGALDVVGGKLKDIGKSTVLWGVGLSVLSGSLDNAAAKARDAGDDVLAVGANALATGAQFAGLGALFGPLGAAIGGLGGTIVGFITEAFRSKDTLEELTRNYVALGLAQAENGKITAEASIQLEKAFNNISKFKNFGDKLKESQSKDVQDTNRELNRASHLDEIVKSLFTGIDRTADAEQTRAQILEAANKVLQATLGEAAPDLTSSTLGNIDDEALKKVTKQAFDQIINTFAELAGSPDAAEEIRKRGAQLLETSSPEGSGRGRVSQAGVALARALNELPDLVKKSQIEAQDVTGREQRKNIIDAQREAFGDLRSQIAVPLSNFGKLLGEPINKFQLEIRKFIDDFGQEIIKLNEATLKATTPQKELANKMAEFAKVELNVAQRREALAKTEAVGEFRKVLGELPGAEKPVGRGAKGELLPGFTEEDANKTLGQVRAAFSEALIGTLEEIQQQGIADIDEQRSKLEKALQALPSLEGISEDERKKIVDTALATGKTLVSLESETAAARTNLNKALVTQLQEVLSEQQKEITINRQRREVLSLNTQAAIEELTGIRALVAQRTLEADLSKALVNETQKTIAGLDERIAKEKEVLAADQNNVAAQDKLKILTEERVKQSIDLESELARARIANVKNVIAVSKEAIEAGKKETDFQRTQIAGRAEIVDLLSAGEKQITKFNNKLQVNAEIFRNSQAELASEAAIVNATISDQAEKQARLAEINKQGANLALEHARAEAEIIAERREAIKQVAQELVSNQQDQISAQKAVIDATKGVATAFNSYLQAVDGAILATTQYNLHLRLIEVENTKLLGGFTGIKEELGAVQDAFRDAENSARDVGASEKTLLQIRRDSINQQLQLFNQLLQEQSTLARNFFQSSASDQADLFRGIQEAKNVAQSLGGSFESFKRLGENAINAIGNQLLSLPQETRQRIIQSLETLKTVGGSVGGFTADELLNAIETASLGVSKEGLDVDPLFEVQQRIANLSEEQARLATDQLVASNEQVQNTKQQLEEAQAQKDLAEIQLERTKEEGDKLRGKLGELQGDLHTVLLQQDQNQRAGFQAVTGAIAQATSAITNVLPDALSAKIAQAFREVLSAGNIAVPGLTTGPQTAAAVSTPLSRGTELSESLRQQGSNQALQQQLANQSGQAINIQSEAVNSKSQNLRSNLDNDDLAETNRRLEEVISQLEALNTTSTASQETLSELSLGSAGGALATTTPAAIPDINVNIEGTQTITVTGFEAAITRIVTGLTETFGGFVTEQEARNIAESVVDAIRTQLQRLGILNRNQI